MSDIKTEEDVFRHILSLLLCFYDFCLLRATAEGDVEGDDGLCTLVKISGLAELGLKQILLGHEHLNVAGLAVVHQFVCTSIGIVEHLYLGHSHSRP